MLMGIGAKVVNMIKPKAFLQLVKDCETVPFEDAEIQEFSHPDYLINLIGLKLGYDLEHCLEWIG
jgi:hypothetical protein